MFSKICHTVPYFHPPSAQEAALTGCSGWTGSAMLTGIFPGGILATVLVVQILWYHRGGQVALGFISGMGLKRCFTRLGIGDRWGVCHLTLPDPSIQELQRGVPSHLWFSDAALLYCQMQLSLLKTCRIWKGRKELGIMGSCSFLHLDNGPKLAPRMSLYVGRVDFQCWRQNHVMERVLAWTLGRALLSDMNSPFTSLLFCFLHLSQEAAMRCSLRNLVASVSIKCTHIIPRFSL